jgi:hypothetical protein
MLTPVQILREFPVLKREATPFTINALLARQLAYARSKVNAAGNDGSESDADAGTTSDNAEAGATLDGAETVGNEPDTYPGMPSFNPNASTAEWTWPQASSHNQVSDLQLQLPILISLRQVLFSKLEGK